MYSEEDTSSVGGLIQLIDIVIVSSNSTIFINLYFFLVQNIGVLLQIPFLILTPLLQFSVPPVGIYQ